MKILATMRPDFPAYATPLDKLGWWALRIGCVSVLAFLLLPIVVIVPLSFADSSFLVYPIPGWSLRWYQNLFTSEDWTRAARNSFIVAPLATVIAIIHALGLMSWNIAPSRQRSGRSEEKGAAQCSGICVSPDSRYFASGFGRS